MSDYVGHQFGSYHLIRMLGQGGFSDVYLGEHVYLKTEAAIKVLQTRLVGLSMEDFLTEARTIARLEHPNIVRVLDFGIQEATPFLIMPFAPNGTLRQRYPKGSIVPLTALVSYTRQLTSALQYAHNQKIIHRDIKPENILLGRNNEVLLSDFGIAIVAQSTLQPDAQGVVGTVAYMAPEQIQGRPRPASDQYSLAVIVYECLSGDRPFRGGFTELCAQHMFAPPPPLHEKFPGIHPAIEQVVQKALAKEPQQRFTNVEAFADALEEAIRVASHRLFPAASVQLPPPLPFNPYNPTVVAAAPSSSSQPIAPQLPREVAMPLTPLPNEQQPTTVVATPSSHPMVPPRTVPEYSPTPPQPPTSTRGHISRRTIIVGLGLTTGLAAAGGVTWFALSSHWTGTPEKTTTPTALPTPSTIGVPVSTYIGHTNWVASLAWSPNSTLIASGGNDNTVQISKAIDGTQMYNSYHHNGVVSSVAWSPDGKSIASGSSDDTVQVWNPVSGIRLYTYRGVLAQVKCVVWSPLDGTRIAMGGYDNKVHVWDVKTGNTIIYSLHTNAVYGVTWSPDGTRIASASFDGTVQVWNAADGSHIFTYNGHYGMLVRTVAWSPDGAYIASAGGNDGKVQVWDATSGSTIFTYTGHKQFVWAVSWSPNSKSIVSASQDKTVQVWDALTKGYSYTYRGHQDYLHTVGWSPNGQYIASAGGNYSAGGPPWGDTTVKVWRAS